MRTPLRVDPRELDELYFRNCPQRRAEYAFRCKETQRYDTKCVTISGRSNEIAGRVIRRAEQSEQECPGSSPLDSVPPALLRATFSLTIRLLQYLDRGHLPRGIKNALGILLSSVASIALFVLAAATLLSPQKVLVSFRTSGAPKDFAIEPSAGT